MNIFEIIFYHQMIGSKSKILYIYIFLGFKARIENLKPRIDEKKNEWRISFEEIDLEEW